MRNTKSTKKRVVPFILAAVLILSLGTVGALAATNMGGWREVNTDGWHEVTADEYEAIIAGELELDDGVPRYWNGGVDVGLFDADEDIADRNTPAAEFEITLMSANTDGWHVVTSDEYEAIIAGELNLDDGVPRYWNGGVDMGVFDVATDSADRNTSAAEFELTLNGTASFVGE